MKPSILTTAIVCILMFSPALLRAEQPTGVTEHSVWLGVQLTPVPNALAGHLQLEDAGLMVRNVFTDSPADVAGLDRYDVIVKAEGKAVIDDIAAFTRQVSDKKTGDTLELDIYHKGKACHLKITLTTRPSDWSQLQTKYPDERPWYQWDHLQDQLTAPKEWMGRPWAQRFRNHKEDAYDLWRKQQEKYSDALKDWRKQYDKYLEDLKDWRQQHDRYNKALEDWRKRMQESLSADKWKQWQEWYDDFFEGPMQEIQPPAFDEDEYDAFPATQPSTRSGVRFEQHPDGKITAHLYKNDTALSRTFTSANDLKKNAPKLYEQYKTLQEQIR